MTSVNSYDDSNADTGGDKDYAGGMRVNDIWFCRDACKVGVGVVVIAVVFSIVIGVVASSSTSVAAAVGVLLVVMTTEGVVGV